MVVLENSVRAGLASDHGPLVALDDYAARHPERRNLIQHALEQGRCVIAESGGAPLGYAVWDYNFFGFGFIAVLVVDPQHRRRGAGLRLLGEVERLCRSSKLFTSANRSNVAAQALFAKAGFSPSGYIENLDRNDPELVYCKELSQ
jgi:ribosomal protein S18 acetylase RimI-like enzyme